MDCKIIKSYTERVEISHRQVILEIINLITLSTIERKHPTKFKCPHSILIYLIVATMKIKLILSRHFCPSLIKLNANIKIGKSIFAHVQIANKSRKHSTTHLSIIAISIITFKLLS